jgi:hypothetical protein
MVVAANNEVTWEEGKPFVFDDSFEHEVSFGGKLCRLCFQLRKKWRHCC